MRKIITADFKSVREKFIAKTFQTFKTVKKAFVEWKGSKSHIEFDRFKQMMENSAHRIEYLRSDTRWSMLCK